MSKKRKKKRREQSEARRRRALERLRKAVEEQHATAPPPPPPPLPLPSKPPLSSPLPDEPVESEENGLWAQFKRANLEGKKIIFLSTLETGELDDEYAFGMLNGIRSELDLRDRESRLRYTKLVERLRQHAPKLYRQSIAYYHANLIHDAVADGRWEALPELLVPFAEEPERTIETFTRVIDQLSYHGQVRPLIQVLAQAWPQVSKSAEILPWATDEFAGKLMHLSLLDYMETAPVPSADDPALLEATSPYGVWKKGWLERFVPRLTASDHSPWQPADFGEAVDADQWHDNINNLLAEFVANRHRAGVPYGRGYLAWMQLAEALERQFVAPAAPPRPRDGGGGRGKRKGKGKKHGGKSRSKAPSSPLVPRYQTMDKVLVNLFPFLGAQPYKAAAVLELLPAYLHFLARLGLIHPAEMDAALTELQPLKKRLSGVLENYGADLRAVDAAAAAWSGEALDGLRNDPVLAEARATPPASPAPQPEKPTPRPSALLTYTFKITYLRASDVWRTIEIVEDQTLDNLHYAIQRAVDFDTDHLYSFFMSGYAWDKSTEYAAPYADGPSAARMKIRDLNLRMKQRFLYLFDYGDEHRFEVQLVGINPDAPKGDYPRVVEHHGKNPSQYAGWDDEEWEEDEDEV